MLHSNITLSPGGNLCFAGVDCVALAREFGTPVMLLDEDRVRERCRVYLEALSREEGGESSALYASKAFCCKEIYRVMNEEGMGADLVSCGEMATARAAGFPLARAFFHGNNKTDEDLSRALECGVGHIVVDGEEELSRLNEIAAARGNVQPILLRITPGIDPHTHRKISTGGVDSKFGSAIATGAAARITEAALALPHVKLDGFHCHIGSQIFDPAPFTLAADLMLDFLSQIRERTGYAARYLNLGGGFGVRYVESDPQIDIAANIARIAAHLRERCAAQNYPLPALLLEPGRSIVADAGMTLYTVGSVKEIPGVKNYVSVDGGMTDNPRYTLYESAYSFFLANRASERADFVCTVGGRCCESGDLLGEGVTLPRPRRGDILAAAVTGAYNYAMASNYNRVPRPPVVFLRGGVPRLAIRRETDEDLLRYDL